MKIARALSDGTEIDLKILSDFYDNALNHHLYEDEFLKQLKTNFNNMELIIPKNTIAYRARLYKANISLEEDELVKSGFEYLMNTKPKKFDPTELIENAHLIANDKLNRKKFKGFNAKESLVNPNHLMIEDGRCNHKYSPCLYISDSINTAISEIKPNISANISVAKIKVLEDLKIINLVSNKEKDFVAFVGEMFTQNVTLEHPEVYAYSQAICDYVKYHKYDGIAYPSCQLNGGINYAIFTHEKCTAISSDVYTVNSIIVNYSKRKI